MISWGGGTHPLLLSPERVKRPMIESVEFSLEQGLERYQQGEAAESLLADFKELCDRTPKNAAAWSCLAWLYLLTNKPESALKAAQKGVKLDKVSPQNRINLVLAMLETKKAGVREHIDMVRQIIGLNEEVRQEIAENIEDGLMRDPDWKSLQKVKAWLSE
jgi:predicted Zn-dependent protease